LVGHRGGGADLKAPLTIAINRLTSATWRKLEKTTAFNPEKAFPKQEYEKLAPVERALFDYYKAAMAENPLYKDLGRAPEHQELFVKYQAYIKKGRNKAEAEVRKKVVAEFKKAVAKEQE